VVPKLWKESIEAHRQDVHDAILDAAWALVAQRGLPAVGMSHIAEKTGVGRATLYKYFGGDEAILIAWHKRQIARHLEHLAAVRDQADSPVERLLAVLEAHAFISRDVRKQTRAQLGGHGSELAGLLHQGDDVAQVHKQLQRFVRELIAGAAKAGDIRRDVTPDELATYCLHALAAAGSLPTKAAIRRLVGTTMAGLQSPRRPS